MRRLALAALAAGLAASCSGGETARDTPTLAVTVRSAGGPRVFTVEVARTPEEQTRGLMFRADIPRDGGMLFAPYPPDGGAPREASFWMKNTPLPLDIVFIDHAGHIVSIARDTTPLSETPIPSEAPAKGVLELNAGTAAALDIGPGDRVVYRAFGM